MIKNMKTEEIYLVQTCGACPEQYDAYEQDTVVGYLRLRHGYFTVHCPWVGGEIVFSAEPVGDGIFAESEREYFLLEAKKAISFYYNSKND